MLKAEPTTRGFDPARLNRVGTWMDGYVQDRKFPGSSVLIARGGTEVYFNATGQRNIASELPFGRDTVARIYSMTKPVTTVAAMILLEKGLFHLDAPVSDFLPSFADMSALVPGATNIDQTEPCASPSLHQLMTHTSGLSYPFNPGVLSREMDDLGIIFAPNQGVLAEMADQVGSLPLAFTPGSRWEYSVGIDILGRVIEIVSGQTLESFFVEHIFDPLGMNETRFSVPEDVGDRFATLYTPLAGNAMDLNAAEQGGDTLRMADQAGSSPFEKTTMLSGGGGLVGTIDDYMSFVEMLRRGGIHEDSRILSPRTTEFMMRNHLSGDIASMGPQSFAEQPMEGMGFGLGGAVVLDPGRVRSHGHIGDFSWGGMASTFFWIDPVLDLSVIFFTQLSPSSSYPARPQLKALVHGALVE